MTVAHLNPQSSDFGDICALSSPFLHQPTGSCMCRVQATALSELQVRVRDRVNSLLLRSLDKGGGYVVATLLSLCRSETFMSCTLLDQT